MKTTILYVGRGRPTPTLMWQELGVMGYQVTVVSTQKVALELAVSSPPSVAIVDGTTARLSGLNTCRALRRCQAGLPLILITDQKQKLPATLADCVLIRPFTTRRFIQCIEQVLRTTCNLHVAGLMLDLRNRTVTGPRGLQRLNPKEFALLELFMRNPGRILSRSELMQTVWQTSYLGDTRTLDVHMRWLREKIEPFPGQPSLIVTHRNAGYRLIAPPALPEQAQASA